MGEIVRILTDAQKGQLWRSLLSGTEYRWGEGGWLLRTRVAPEWHPINPDSPYTGYVYPFPGEKYESFEEEPVVGPTAESV